MSARGYSGTLMSSEEYRRRILELIDENNDPWVKASFYGDPDVSRIVEELYRRWEETGFKGIALDYATLAELRILVRKAEEYFSMDKGEAMRRALRR